MKIQIDLCTDTFNSYLDAQLQIESLTDNDKVFLKFSDDFREVSVSISELLTALKILKAIKE